MTLQLLLQILLDNLMIASVLMLATMGIVLIFRTSYTTNFAQGMIASFAAFLTAILSVKLSAKFFPDQPSVIPLIIGIIAGMITGFVIGLIIDIFIIRKARNINSSGKQMITMGLVLVITGLIPVIYGTLPIAMPRFSYNIIPIKIGSIHLTIPTHNLISIIIAFIVITITFVSLKFTKWGLGVRATASNETVAGMMGVNTHFITAMSWAIAGTLGALAAALHAPTVGNVTSSLMINMQVNGFLAAILGSFSSFLGPVVGAILIPLSTGVIAYFSPVWREVIAYSLVLIVVLIKPVGLFGKKVAKKV